jgi:hypothetical protein
MTPEDRRAQIDRRFDETFAVFDARMRKEQETISQERAGRAGSAGAVGGTESGDETMAGAGGEAAGAGAGDGEEGAGAGDEGEGGEGDGGDGSGEAGGVENDGSGQPGGGGGVGGGGPKGGGAAGGVPSDIPDGRDDDIVARQLREAAMKETDPELRERLWEEYRKYKQSTQ